MQKHHCARWASVVQTFWPLTTHWSPSRTPRVWTPARSEPALGSEYPWHQSSSTVWIFGQEASLLVLGAVGEQGRGEEPFAEEADAGRRVRSRVLLAEDDLLGEVGAPPPVFVGPGQTEPAVLAEQLLPLDAQVPAGLVGGTASPADLGELAREVLAEPGADLVAERGLVGRISKVHGGQRRYSPAAQGARPPDLP